MTVEDQLVANLLDSFCPRTQIKSFGILSEFQNYFVDFNEIQNVSVFVFTL